MVKNKAEKSAFPPMAASKGVMKLAVNVVTMATNAAPMTTATARSTTLPRSRNFLKPVIHHSFLRAADRPMWSVVPRSASADQHSRVQHAVRVDSGLCREECPRERVGPLDVVPGTVVPADGVVMGDRAAGREDGLARGSLDLVPLGQLAAAPG